MHTHVSLTGATELMITLGLGENHVPVAVTQVVHIAALACVLLPGISCGATVVVLPMFDAAVALDQIERWGCTDIMILPAMLRFPGRRAGSPSAQRQYSRHLPGRWRHRAGNPFRINSVLCFWEFPCGELYGMTETVPVTCIRENAPRFGSIGPVIDLVDARVADLTGKECWPTGESANYKYRAPPIVLAYWDNEQATSSTFDDGWLRTGDLVRRDADGGFFWFRRPRQVNHYPGRFQYLAAGSRRGPVSPIPLSSRLVSSACPTRSMVKR